MTFGFTNWRGVVVALAALAVSLGAARTASAADAAAPAASTASAPARVYAVVSLIGDEFSVVHRRAQIGSRIDNNDRRAFPIGDATFDGAALAAAERAALIARPGASVLQASIRDPRLFALQDKLLAEDSASSAMRAALRGLLQKSGATHLLLVTKRRDAAAIKVLNGSIGAGILSGIGFYIDNQTPMQRVEARDSSVGFFAPFAYVTVSLIDLATMQTLRSRIALESTMTLAVEKEGAERAWDVLSAQAKVEALDNVVRLAVEAGTAAVLAD